MQTYMTHKKLGGMLVYLDDIPKRISEGWVEGELPSQPVEEVETPEDAYEKKFGKKPHHRMSLDTIIAALEE